MLKLYSAADLQEAYLILHQLNLAGIDARILNEHAQGALGEIPFTHAYPEVWLVDDADESRARKILADYESRGSMSATRECIACGESSPEGFEVCWHCGAPIE